MEKELYLSYSNEDTQELAQKLISNIKSGGVICLYGPMAAGKTTFTQGIGLSLGLSRVTSPTYLIMKEYLLVDHPFLKRLYHLDLYRIGASEEIKAFDLEEIWSNPENLVLIEWPEIIGDLLPDRRIDISIKPTSQNERQITINNHTISSS